MARVNVDTVSSVDARPTVSPRVAEDARVEVAPRQEIKVEAELREKLSALEDEEKFGSVLRAKGIVNADDGDWIYFDYVPGEIDIRRGGAAVTGRFCVIGAKIKEDALKELFNLG